jgi:hypothetical protein
MSIHSTGLGHGEALVVSPSRARAMLDIGQTRLYELLATKELESFKDGKSRKITVKSIHGYIDRLLAAAQEERAA